MDGLTLHTVRFSQRNMTWKKERREREKRERERERDKERKREREWIFKWFIIVNSDTQKAQKIIPGVESSKKVAEKEK